MKKSAPKKVDASNLFHDLDSETVDKVLLRFGAYIAVNSHTEFSVRNSRATWKVIQHLRKAHGFVKE